MQNIQKNSAFYTNILKQLVKAPIILTKELHKICFVSRIFYTQFSYSYHLRTVIFHKKKLNFWIRKIFLSFLKKSYFSAINYRPLFFYFRRNWSLCDFYWSFLWVRKKLCFSKPANSYKNECITISFFRRVYY